MKLFLPTLASSNHTLIFITVIDINHIATREGIRPSEFANHFYYRNEFLYGLKIAGCKSSENTSVKQVWLFSQVSQCSSLSHSSHLQSFQPGLTQALTQQSTENFPYRASVELWSHMSSLRSTDNTIIIDVTALMAVKCSHLLHIVHQFNLLVRRKSRRISCHGTGFGIKVHW